MIKYIVKLTAASLLTSFELKRIKNYHLIEKFILFLLFFSVVSVPATAGDLENRVKTAYIYNFTKFIEWPGEKLENEPIRICFVGNDTLRTVIGELKNRQVNGRSIKIIRFNDISTVNSCDIAYISFSEERQLPQILERLGGTHVLTVSDIPQFSKRGGMIGFITERGRVKIEVNPLVLRQAGLKVSAKLLEVARITQ